MQVSPRQKIIRRWEALKKERSLYQEAYRDLADYIQPHRARFNLSDRSRKRTSPKIINSRPLHAARVLAAGMMAGITPPSRPWFQLTTSDPDLAEYGPVKTYLFHAANRMRTALLKSNLYNAFYNSYADLGTFGISALHIESDDEDGLRGYNLPIGSYALANSARLQVDTCYVEKNMTVLQLVELFGYNNVSKVTRAFYDKGEYDVWREVLHVIEPNRSRTYGNLDPSGMRWRSVWMEMGVPDSEGFLRVSGYHEFPVIAPRWEVTGTDTYASTCPGMTAIGDVMALQLLERRKAQLVDKTANPPMGGPSSLMHKRVSLLPGDFTPVDVTAAGQKIEPLMVVPPQALPALKDLIAEHENRIGIMYFSDLWLMMSQPVDNRREITAREVAERHEEKMLQLGPVMERLQDEFLDPIIDRTYYILDRRGDLPPPPPELANVELKVEYISILAQAQKLLGTSGVERFAGFIGQAATVRPDVLDMVNWDNMVRHYADSLGVPPDQVMDEEEVKRIREARARQQEMQRQSEMMQQAAQGAKTLSETELGGNTALDQIARNMTGGFA